MKKMDIDEIRSNFPMLDKDKLMQGSPLIFLDNASTTFKPYQVFDAIKDYYFNKTSNSHRGDYDLCFNMDNYVYSVRKKVAKFINARKPEEIVFTAGASMSINIIAYGLLKYIEEGDEIIIDEAEHASNVLPWFKIAEIKKAKIVYIPLDEEGRITANNLRKVITNKTKIVSVAHVTNVLGFKSEVKEMAHICHEFKAFFVVDGAQSVPHMKTDVVDIDCDFLAFSAHKMYGPTGLGIIYGKKELLDEMDPLLSGGGMNAKFLACGDVRYLSAPERLEAGTLNLEGIFGLGAAIDFINDYGITNIERRESELRHYAITKLKKVKNIIIYNENAEGAIITINIKDVFAQDLSTYLNSKGIATRSGQHCAKILIDHLHSLATVRISLAFYNTKEEIDALCEALDGSEGFLDAYFS